MQKEPFIVIYCEQSNDRAAALSCCLAGTDTGATIVHIATGEALRTYCRSFENAQCERPGLIIMDLTFFTVVGDGILHVIRSVPRLRFVPVVFLLDREDQIKEIEAYSSGVNSCLVRWSTNEECVHMMRTCITFWSKWNVRAAIRD